MVASFFTTMKEAGAAFIQFLISAIQSIWGIFYDSSANEGAGEWTSIGIFIIVALTIGIVYGVIRWISKLVHLRS